MNLQKLKYIVEIADCGSITKAANKLFISQPYLSKIISDFEMHINKKIFVRKNHGLELTDEGHKVYILAHSIIHQMDLLEGLGGEDGKEERNTKLAFSVGNFILKESILLNYFNISNFTRNDVDFYETTISSCIEKVEDNQSEFAVIVIDDMQKPLLKNIIFKKGLEYQELDEGYYYFHLHRDHPLANQEKILIKDLIKYPFVRLKMDQFSIFSSENFKKEYPQANLVEFIVVNNYRLYLSIVKNNGAFMVGNKWQISELEKMGIKSVRFSSLKHKVYLGIIKKEAMSFSIEAEKFLHLLKESYGLNRL